MLTRYGSLRSVLLGMGAALVLAAATPSAPDLDPDALAILKQTSQSITGAPNLAFHVRVARDRLATNDQIVTYFNLDEVTVSRPNKLRINMGNEHHTIQFFFDGSKTTLFEPEKKLYLTRPVSGTIDDMLKSLDTHGVSFPMSNLLESDPYDSLAKGLQTAYIVGRVNIDNKTFIHLVFTSGASADWQAWIEPGDKPVPRAVIIIYKSVPGSPRITMDFTDWNLNAQPAAAMFNFVKPAEAHEIQFLPANAVK